MFLRSLFDVSTRSAHLDAAWPSDLGPWGQFENDPARFVYELLLEEYRSIHEHIGMTTQLQNSMMNYVLLIWGASFTLAPVLSNQWSEFRITLENQPWILLLMCSVTMPFGLMYTMWDLRNARVLHHVQHVLRPQFQSIVTSRSSSTDPFLGKVIPTILEWERSSLSVTGGIVGWFAVAYGVMTSLFVYSLPIAASIAYVAIAPLHGFHPSTTDIVFIALNVVLFIAAIIGSSASFQAYARLK